MRISFDFDNTLEFPELQELAKKFIEAGHDVWITTSRIDGYSISAKKLPIGNTDIYTVAENLGIPNNVQFTNYEDKFHYLVDFDLHFDDSEMEVNNINEHPNKCIAFLYKKTTLKTRLI